MSDEQLRADNDALRDELARLVADRREMAATLTGLSRDYAVALAAAEMQERAARLARAASDEDEARIERMTDRITALEDMIGAFFQHRSSHLLDIAWTAYLEKHK